MGRAPKATKTAPRSRRRQVAVAVVVAALVVGGCSSNDATGWREQRRIPADQATGLAPVHPDGLLIGERSSGAIFWADPTEGSTDPLTTLDALDADLAQGGLLGLTGAADERGGDADVLVSSTGSDGHLHVDAVTEDGQVLRRWKGPESQEQANGGRLAILDDGTVLVGVGDLLDPDLVEDPEAPNGKLLALADDGTATVWASGFNNPFALVADGDRVWVADNAPGSREERLLEVTEGEVRQVAAWSDTRVPSGIAVLDDGRLAICWYAAQTLELVEPTSPDATGEVIAEDCRYGVVSLPDGGLAYAADDAVVILAPPT